MTEGGAGPQRTALLDVGQRPVDPPDAFIGDTAVAELLDEPPPAAGRRLALQGGLWSAASQVLPAAGTAVLSVAAGRYLGTGPLGQQSLIAYVNAAVSAIVVISLNTAMLQIGGRLQGAGDRAAVRRLMTWAVGAHLAAGAVVLTVLAVTGEVVGQNRASWLIIGVVAMLDAAADGLAIRLVLTEGWAPIGRLRLIFQFVGPPLGIAFLFAGYGIAGIFAGDGVAALGLLVAVALRYRRLAAADRSSSGADPGGSAVDRAKLRSVRPPVPVATMYSLFSLSAVITQIVTKRVEFIVLAIFSGDVAIGTYSVAFMIVSLIGMIPLGVAAAAMPIIAAAEGSGRVDRANYHLRLSVRLGTLVSIPIVAVVAALGPAAVVLVYGPHYQPAARLVPLTALSLLVAIVTGICAQFWTGRGRLRLVIVTGAIAGTVDIGVAFALVPAFGATGAALANLAGQLTLAATLLVSTVRRTGPLAWRLGGLVRMAVAAAAGAGIGVLVYVNTNLFLRSAGAEVRSAVILAIGGVAVPLVIAGVAVLTKPVGPTEARWLAPLVPRRLSGLLDLVTSRPARGPAPTAHVHASP